MRGAEAGMALARRALRRGEAVCVIVFFLGGEGRYVMLTLVYRL